MVDVAAASRAVVEVLVAVAVVDSVVAAVEHPVAVDVVARVSFFFFATFSRSRLSFTSAY